MSLMSGYGPWTRSVLLRKERPSEAPPEWQWREHPPLLSRRFHFSGYSETRIFLDAMARLSEEHGFYPDTSFGVDYVNVTIHARNGEQLEPKDFEFAARVNEITDLARGG